MHYISTRGGVPAVSSARAIVEGLAPDGGLYVMEPGAIPKLDWRALRDLDYPALAARILSALLPDFGPGEAETLVRRAYAGKFSAPELTPLREAGDDLFPGTICFSSCTTAPPPLSRTWPCACCPI